MSVSAAKRPDVKQEIQETQNKQDSQDETKKNTEAVAGHAGGETESVAEKMRNRLMASVDRGELSTLTIEQHVLAAWQCRDDEIMESSNIYSGGEKIIIDGQWRSSLWTFTRMMKTHPQLVNATGKAALKVVEAVIGRWATDAFWKEIPGQKKLPAGVMARAPYAWAEHFDMEAEDAQTEFLATWDKIRLRPGVTALDQAIDNATKSPVRLPQDGAGITIPTDGYQRFISLSAWLQVARGASPIVLPTAMIGQRLNVKAMTITRYRQAGIADNFLRVVKDHTFRSNGKGESTEFVFNVSRVPMIQEKAHPDTQALWDRAGTIRTYHQQKREQAKAARAEAAAVKATGPSGPLVFEQLPPQPMTPEQIEQRRAELRRALTKDRAITDGAA